MNVVHLLASPFYGGPERQALGLARTMTDSCRSVFLSFAEGGKAQALLDQVKLAGLEGHALNHNFPHLRRSAAEIADWLQSLQADVLCCHGYKPDILGWLAARQTGVPAISVSHGWTAATFKVRLYETLDRLALRWMAAVVCVSQAQADKVRRAHVPAEKIVVIRNAVGPDAFSQPDPAYQDLLAQLFPEKPGKIVGAAGRLSPEKGFLHLVEAAALVMARDPKVGFVHFGDGPQRDLMRSRIAELGLERRFVLAGFRDDLGKFLPHLHVLALPSFTEGLPVIVLEALAAGVPVVATAVGGTPEAIDDGRDGFLVPPGNAASLADRLLKVLADEPRRLAMGQQGRAKVQERFTFERQRDQYVELFHRVIGKKLRG